MLCPRYTIQLSVEERQQIEALLRAGKTQQRVAKRAAAILLAEAGMNNQEIVDHFSMDVDGYTTGRFTPTV